LPDLVVDADPSACGICFDSGHAQIDEDAVALARLLAPRTICTHLHDNDGKNDLHLPPFHGTIDWPGVMKALAQSGYKGTYTFECLSGTMAQIAEARDRLQKV
jgi:sugar phosphate isomerase/epimerase